MKEQKQRKGGSNNGSYWPFPSLMSMMGRLKVPCSLFRTVLIQTRYLHMQNQRRQKPTHTRPVCQPTSFSCTDTSLACQHCKQFQGHKHSSISYRQFLKLYFWGCFQTKFSLQKWSAAFTAFDMKSFHLFFFLLRRSSHEGKIVAQCCIWKYHSWTKSWL